MYEYGPTVKNLTFHTCIETLPKSSGEKPNVNFLTVDPYFWAMSFVGLSIGAEYDTYC